MMKRAVILSCLLLAFAAGIPGVRAAAPVVRATLKPDTVLIGDRFSIEVLIDKDMMQVVELPTFGTDMVKSTANIGTVRTSSPKIPSS